MSKGPPETAADKKSSVCKVEDVANKLFQGPWMILSDVIAKGTAKEDSGEGSLAASVSIIAQAECKCGGVCWWEAKRFLSGEGYNSTEKAGENPEALLPPAQPMGTQPLPFTLFPRNAHRTQRLLPLYAPSS